MPYRVIYSGRAKSDLLNIERYISDAGSPANAKAYVTAIVAKCDGLAAAPYQGTRRDHLLPGLCTTGFRGRGNDCLSGNRRDDSDPRRLLRRQKYRNEPLVRGPGLY